MGIYQRIVQFNYYVCRQLAMGSPHDTNRLRYITSVLIYMVLKSKIFIEHNANEFDCWCRVAVVAPIGNSDHSSLSAVISTAQAVPNLCVSRKVFLKHQVNWNTVCGAMWDLPWRNIYLLTVLWRFWTSIFAAGWTLCTHQDHPCT